MIYTIDGMKVSRLQRGINIIRSVDRAGKITIRRVIVKNAGDAGGR